MVALLERLSPLLTHPYFLWLLIALACGAVIGIPWAWYWRSRRVVLTKAMVDNLASEMDKMPPVAFIENSRAGRRVVMGTVCGRVCPNSEDCIGQGCWFGVPIDDLKHT